MNAINALRQLFLLTLLIFVGAVPVAIADQSFYGNYYWENGSSEKYAKSVDLVVRLEDPAKISVSLDISWDPGAHVEIGGTAKPTDVLRTTQSDGSVIYVVPFLFSDGFNNAGTGTLTIHGNECVVSATITDVTDERAARQYGNYTLQRQ